MRAAKPCAREQILDVAQQAGPAIHQVLAVSCAIKSSADGYALARRDGDCFALAAAISASMVYGGGRCAFRRRLFLRACLGLLVCSGLLICLGLIVCLGLPDC